jgi:hypothetical protein
VPGIFLDNDPPLTGEIFAGNDRDRRIKRRLEKREPLAVVEAEI